MNVQGWLEIAFFVVCLTAIVPLLGGYLARVLQSEPVALDRVLGPVERGLLRLFGPGASRQQNWKSYAVAAVAFNVAGFLVLLLILRTQSIHPWNPLGLTAMPWDVSLNTAASFVSNTNWQFYGGETSLSFFSQMAGITVQNFLSAATGIAVVAAVIRGIAARGSDRLGNFWVDVTRITLYVLLPISIVGALFLISQGAIQNLSGPLTSAGVAGGRETLALGPAASQELIKMLGTNGGGFFNVNASMPFSNPTALTNFVLMLAILSIPAALTYTYGRIVGSRRQGWALYAAMLAMFVVATAVVYLAESDATPAMAAAGLDGANMEGKEVRFGIGSSSLFSAITTVASCGAVNSAMEALSGLGGAVPMANMMTGEVIFGGVGSGLYGMLLFVLLAVFLAGLMVGRTPEYLGKKIEAREIKLVVVGSLVVPLAVLLTTALAIGTQWGMPSIYDSGPQGFSETLYAYTSQGNNNGSAFAGYTGFVQPGGTNEGAYGITFANLLGGASMLLGRFGPMLIALAVAGALATKRVAPPSAGTMRTDTLVFGGLLVAVIVLVALLVFVPALLLGPIVQALGDGLY